jgi:hypothetical protein
MTKPKTNITVTFESRGPTGNSFFLVGRVQAALKQGDKELYEEFRQTFKLREHKSYESVLDTLKEWVYLHDDDGVYL